MNRASPPPSSGTLLPAAALEETLQQAILHHQAGRFPQAEQLYRTILQSAPAHPDANHNLGILAGQIGQAAAGLPYLKTALDARPSGEQYLLSYTNALMACGQYGQACTLLTKALQQGLDSAALHINLGNALRASGRLEEAEASLQRALHRLPGSMPDCAADRAATHYNLGGVLQDLGRLDAAAASYRQALQFNPELADAHNNLGIVLHDLHQLDAAAASFQRTLDLNPDDANAHYNLGKLRNDQGLYTDAVAHYRNALALAPHHADAHHNLANALNELGHLEQAADAYVAAISIRPDFIDAHYGLSALKTYSTGDPHLTMLEQQIDRLGDVPMETRIRYWFALGKVREDLGLYDTAFAAYQEGNRLQHALVAHNRVSVDEDDRLARMLSVFSAEFFSQQRPQLSTPTQGKTPIFIVGMYRSGTSLLEQILSTCPGLYGAGELTDMSEVVTAAMPDAAFMHFPDAVPGLTAQDFQRMGEQYIERVWRRAPEATHITDKMPINFFYVGMIHLMFPGAKIIHAMRDPMDSCFSCYARLFNEHNLDFAYDLTELGHYYARYIKLMQHWHAVLPAGTILDVRYEDMVADTEGQARHLLAYLGLPWDERCLSFYQNQRRVATASAAQVRKPIYRSSLARWERFRAHLAPLYDLVKEYRNTPGHAQT